MTINNRGLYGAPTMPYIDYRAYANSTVYLDLTFLDHTGVGQIPTSFVYQVDDITNYKSMIPASTVVPTNYMYTLILPNTSMQMTNNWQGSQLCQVLITATLPDGSSVPSVTIVELVAVQTPFGA